MYKLDSLLKLDKVYLKEDSKKLDLYVKILIKTYNYTNDIALFQTYSDRSIKLGQKLKNGPLLADSYHYTGFHYQSRGVFDKAEDYYNLSIKKAKEFNNLEGLSSNYLNLSALYNDLSNYSKALDANLAATEIFHKLGDLSSTAACYVNIAGIYSSLNQQKTAIDYLNKALKIFNELGDTPYAMGLTYSNLSSAYLNATANDLKQLGVTDLERQQKVLNYVDQSQQIAIEQDIASLLAANYEIKGKINELFQDKSAALDSYQKSLAQARRMSGKLFLAQALNVLAKFHESENKLNQAEEMAQEALKIGQQNNYVKVERDAFEVLSAVAEKRRNFDKALNFYRNYINSKDKLFNEEKEKEITRKQLELNFGVKEREYQLRQQLTDADLKQKSLIAKQQEQQLRLRNQQLALSDKEKSLQRLTFLQKQADLENEKLAQSNLLKQQEYKSLLYKQEKNRQIALQQTALSFNKNINLFLGVLAMVLLTSAIIVFYAQRKAVRLNRIVTLQKQELEKLNTVKDRIFSVVGHDLRSPVNSLISITQLLEDGNISQDKLIKYAGILKQNLGYTSAMMENLLNWASSQMQGFKPIFEAVNLANALNDVMKVIEANSSNKKLALIIDVDDNLICYTDANMLALVLRNLISNAIKFTPTDGKVVISAKADAKFIAINVQDNGIGLTATQIESINSSAIYTETGKTTRGTNDEKGTGIGLALCKKFAHLMKGSLHAESDGNGSKLTLSLPRA